MAFLFIGSIASADNLLVIEMKDAGRVTFNLEEQPGIGLFKSDLFVNTNNVNTFYAIEKIEKLYFADSSTDINDVENKTSEINFTYKNEILTIESNSEIKSILLYDSEGKNCNSYINNHENNASISFQQMQKGIYIVNIDNEHSIKIIK